MGLCPESHGINARPDPIRSGFPRAIGQRSCRAGRLRGAACPEEANLLRISGKLSPSVPSSHIPTLNPAVILDESDRTCLDNTPVLFFGPPRLRGSPGVAAIRRGVSDLATAVRGKSSQHRREPVPSLAGFRALPSGRSSGSLRRAYRTSFEVDGRCCRVHCAHGRGRRDVRAASTTKRSPAPR